MKAKYPGKCVETGRRFEVGDNVKWLGKGKGCILMDTFADQASSSRSKSWDGNPFNDAGEPMMTGEQYRHECNEMEMNEYYGGYDDR